MPSTASTELQNPRQNLILGALRVEEFARLQPELEAVHVSIGQVIHEAGSRINDVYFPTTCLVSLNSTAESGVSVGLAMTGNDGLVGISAVLGSETSPYRVVVQNAGGVYRLHAELLQWHLDHGTELQRLALRYTQNLMLQMAQTAVCNRHHTIDQQLCRWLLTSLDRLPGNTLTTTHAAIASLLGVRRETVTEAAGKLQTAGLITYTRGHVTILDRHGLESRSCECYRVAKSESVQIPPPLPDAPTPFSSRPNPASLRKLALLRLRDKPPAPFGEPSGFGPLMHELQVHQVELEMHNEQLIEAYDEADNLRLRYADLYDFAPVAFITINALSVIQQINLTGAIMLGIKRSEAIRHRFGSSVVPADLPQFNRFLEDVLNGRIRQHIQLMLNPTTHHGPATVLIDAIPDESGQECRMVVSDFTVRQQLLTALQASEERFRDLIDKLPISLLITQDGLVRLTNVVLLNLLGYSLDEIIDQPFLPLIAADAQAVVTSMHNQRMAGDDTPQTLETCLLRQDGQRVACQVYIHSIEWHGRVASFAVLDDVTERNRIRDALMATEQRLRTLASIDELTGLANRRQFFIRLNEELARVQRRTGYGAMLMVLDVDHLKVINDTAGHAAGDAVLCEVAAILGSELRQVDTAGRIGGEEFAVLLPDADFDEARIFAERLRLKIENSVLAANVVADAAPDDTPPVVNFTVSIGLAAMASTDKSIDAALARANTALARATNSGRNRVEVWHERQTQCR
jgi:diguanylate cyclase (GGDEF)-like protein/PAS domain S-box-containing protein